jgi:hypothetical protein
VELCICDGPAPGQPLQLVVPRALQMGWNESPAYFCATTETVRDVAQTWIDEGKRQFEHPMEGFTVPTESPRRHSTVGPTHQMSPVYVDDFLLAAVEDGSGTLLQRTARATLQAIHNVFPSPTATGTPDAKDPISEKKLAKGDARWDTTKEILGYLLEGVARTIRLPAQKHPQEAPRPPKEVSVYHRTPPACRTHFTGGESLLHAGEQRTTAIPYLCWPKSPLGS